MTKRANDNPPDPAQMSLSAIVADLPAVRRAKKANTLSRVHRRLIEPIETDQDNEARLSFQHTVFCQTGLPIGDRDVFGLQVPRSCSTERPSRVTLIDIRR